MIEAINILIDEQCDHIPYTMTLIEILLTAALLLSYFGHPEDLDARNSTLGWSIVLFLQALFWTIIVLG